MSVRRNTQALFGGVVGVAAAMPTARARPAKVSALAEFLIAELTFALNGTLNVGDRG
jgi:hypothetical protein